MPQVDPTYPTQWEGDVVLRDGSVARVRPIRPEDADGVHRFHAGQSEESIYLRFFAPLRRLSDRDVHRFTNVDHHDRVALVVTLRSEIIGIGRFDRIDATSAEVAFNISDAHQGRGIGSVLLEHLAAIADEFGITRFVAEVLPQNRKMLTVFSEAGYEVSRRIEDGVVAVTFDIEPTERSQAVALAREHRAEASSMQAVLAPASIAIVGVSRRQDSIGHQILTNLLASGFAGPIHVVNNEALEVLGFPTHAKVSDIGEPVDLVIVAVPAAAVLDVVDDCAVAGVRALLVVSAGFAETGRDQDAQVQAELLQRARSAGMRVIGPNSFGVINNDPSVRLNATLAPQVPPPGGLGLFAQSGALGIAVLASAARRNLGISIFASAGNRIDVSGNDFMQYWIDDPATKAVGLHLESMGNPRKFTRIARHLARAKPVMVVKSGISAFGLPPGHRVRATRSNPRAFADLLRQSGVIRVDNVHVLFDVAQLVVHQPLPAGNRVAIVTNSAALGALTAGSALSEGLVVSHGPVDVAPDADADTFRAALDAALADEAVDSVLTCFIPPLVTMDEDVIDAVRAVANHPSKPVAATFLGLRGVDDTQAIEPTGSLTPVPPAGTDTNGTDTNGTDTNGTDTNGTDTDETAAAPDLSALADGADPVVRALPVYSMPEDAVRALAKATRYGAWRAKEHGVPVDPIGIDRVRADAFVEQILATDPAGRELSEDEAATLLSAYGITLWQRVRVSSEDEAVQAADAIGYPVVVKSTAPLVRHQPGIGAIRVDLSSPQEVRAAYRSLTERLQPLAADSFVVQRMATPGVACVIATAEDPLFGPLVSFSVAGPPTDLLEDIAYRVPPLTDTDVSDLISSVRAAPMLKGHRGQDPVHLGALGDIVARLSVLADEIPEIEHLSLNPVNAHPGGVDVLGAEIRIGPAAKRKDPGRRAMT